MHELDRKIMEMWIKLTTLITWISSVFCGNIRAPKMKLSHLKCFIWKISTEIIYSSHTFSESVCPVGCFSLILCFKDNDFGPTKTTFISFSRIIDLCRILHVDERYKKWQKKWIIRKAWDLIFHKCQKIAYIFV